jgi:hypothetical protein
VMLLLRLAVDDDGRLHPRPTRFWSEV